MAGVHDGHRDRLRETFLKSGLDGFHEHNVLELLLFYSIPRKDTNEIAHALIEEFGSIDKVFDADVERLTKVKGVTQNSAVLIKMLPAIARYYMSKKAEKKSRFNRLKTSKGLAEYFSPRFVGETHEVLHALLLDNKLQPIICKKMAEGTTESVDMRIERILKFTANYEAVYVAVSHNHPDGSPNPSSEDITMTMKLYKALKLINSELIDHIIIGNNGSFTSMCDIGYFAMEKMNENY